MPERSLEHTGFGFAAQVKLMKGHAWNHATAMLPVSSGTRLSIVRSIIPDSALVMLWSWKKVTDHIFQKGFSLS